MELSVEDCEATHQSVRTMSASRKRANLNGLVPRGFLRTRLFDQAMTHRSAATSDGDSNERLEFLGDAVVQLAVTSYLFRRYPELPEGRMTKVRAAVVNTHSLALVADSLGLGERLRFVSADMADLKTPTPSMLADCFEATVGALYLSVGPEQSEEFVVKVLSDLIDQSVPDDVLGDYKSRLQELVAASTPQSTLTYRDSWSGPDHDRTFTSLVLLGGETLGEGLGKSKKEAQQAAAKVAVQSLTKSYRPGLRGA